MPPAAGSRLLRVAPYFPVADVAATVAHYRDTLGFQVEYLAGSEFAIVARDGCALMFRRVPEPGRIVPIASQGGTWDAFWWISDVQALFEELLRKNAVIVYPITLQPYGMKEFAVRDPDGHVLGFGQAWPPPEV